MKNTLQIAQLFLLTACLIGPCSISHANNIPYTAENVLAFKRIGQVVVSPNGNEVAFTAVEAKPSPLGLKWQYSLYIDDKNNGTRLLTTGDEISGINWSPNGKQLAYLTDNKIIWIDEVKSNATEKLITFNGEILSFKWSPSGEFIAFTANEEKSKKVSALIPKDVRQDYINTRLYLIRVKSNATAVSLTSPNYSLSQFFVFPGFDWSPDGQSIAFSYQPKAGARYAQENKIGIINIKTSAIKNIPYTENHTGVQPAYSPDGQWIAYKTNLPFSKFATELNNDIQLFGRVCVIHTKTFESHCLVNTPDGDVQILGWNQLSNQIYVLDNDKTNGLRIYSLKLDSSSSAQLISKMDGFIEPATISFNNTHTYFGFGYEKISQAPEAYISAVSPFKLEKISHLQSPAANSVLGKAEVIHWKSTDGMDIEGLLVTPVNYDTKKRYPLYVAVHGGPNGTFWQRYLGGCDEYGEMIDPTTCWANILSLGFVILETNPRGSSGYGMPFSLANFGDFGGGDYHDIMSGVDYVIQKGIADPNHLAVGGWSFGGYMTAWIVSQNNRFKAAVDGDGNTDFISFSGTSDIPNYYVKYLGNAFWENNSLYLQRAPISYVKNILTPLLILEGENDARVPPGQAYELYTALDIQHKPVKMLLLPGQGHVPTNPNISLGSIKEVDTWLQKAL